MSTVCNTKVLCPQNLFSRKSQRDKGRIYVQLCGHATFVLLTPARAMTIVNKLAIFCNDVNKTRTSVKFLAINILRYVSCVLQYVS